MKILEYGGVLLAMGGFLCLASGFLLVGFMLGLLSTIFLFSFFVKVGIKSQMGLQVFFMCANVLGILNNMGLLN